MEGFAFNGPDAREVLICQESFVKNRSIMKQTILQASMLPPPIRSWLMRSPHGHHGPPEMHSHALGMYRCPGCSLLQILNHVLHPAFCFVCTPVEFLWCAEPGSSGSSLSSQWLAQFASSTGGGHPSGHPSGHPQGGHPSAAHAGAPTAAAPPASTAPPAAAAGTPSSSSAQMHHQENLRSSDPNAAKS